MIALSPSSKTSFEKVLWLGSGPSNEAREVLLAKLLHFLGYEGGLEYAEWGKSVSFEGGQRTLCLGNFEEFKACSKCPEFDSKQYFLGLFVDEAPASTSLLSFYQKKEVSFILSERASVDDLKEALSDLLQS